MPSGGFERDADRGPGDGGLLESGLHAVDAWLKGECQHVAVDGGAAIATDVEDVVAIVTKGKWQTAPIAIGFNDRQVVGVKGLIIERVGLLPGMQHFEGRSG
jgi:hypothetical protein